jgi:Stigma-specific protein, Stig1
VVAQRVRRIAAVLASTLTGTPTTAADVAFNALGWSTARGVNATVLALAANETAAKITIQFPSSEVSIMERLDEFSKLLATSVSRRESLRSIGAILAGAVLSPLMLGTAWAARPDRCTAFCRSCPTKKKRNQCVAACRACNGNTNRVCGSCGAYVCCASGSACCNGTCTPVLSDRNNCGACGNVCPAGVSCINGTCSASEQCFGGQAWCDGACREIALDPSYCGGCFTFCGPNENCAGGFCQPAE